MYAYNNERMNMHLHVFGECSIVNHISYFVYAQSDTYKGLQCVHFIYGVWRYNKEWMNIHIHVFGAMFFLVSCIMYLYAQSDWYKGLPCVHFVYGVSYIVFRETTSKEWTCSFTYLVNALSWIMFRVFVCSVRLVQRFTVCSFRSWCIAIQCVSCFLNTVCSVRLH